MPSLAREHAVEYADLLGSDSGRLRQRGKPDVWSPLEYACHMRDVLLAQRERVLEARRSDNPTVTPMGRDERVEYDGYAEQNPADVARQIRDAALLFANVLERLGDDDWERTLRFPYPEPDERSLRWLAVHTLHELRHHLVDMHRQLDG
nr:MULTISPECIES: DinB family protein [Nocardia]